MSNEKAIGIKIQSIAKRATTLRVDIQAVGIDIIRHIDEHGEVSLANQLYLAIGDGGHKAALGQWFLNYAKVSANSNPKTKDERPFLFKAEKVTDVESAMINKWYDAVKAPELDKLFDLHAAIEALLKKATKADSAGKLLVTGDATTEALASLRRVAAAIAPTV
jgi:hypothetical protein